MGNSWSLRIGDLTYGMRTAIRGLSAQEDFSSAPGHGVLEDGPAKNPKSDCELPKQGESKSLMFVTDYHLSLTWFWSMHTASSHRNAVYLGILGILAHDKQLELASGLEPLSPHT